MPPHVRAPASEAGYEGKSAVRMGRAHGRNNGCRLTGVRHTDHVLSVTTAALSLTGTLPHSEEARHGE